MFFYFLFFFTMYLQHLKIESTFVSPFVLLPGDPARVDVIGEYLQGFFILNQNREFRVGVGDYQGLKITVVSTGIGCPSTAIAVEELIDAGSRFLVRVGTCGGAWRSDIPSGSLVIPSASVRDEGATLEYIPQGFPAVADYQVIQSLASAAQKRGIPSFVGINRCHDAFYCSLSSDTKWGQYFKDERWLNEDTPILSSEMETAALFVIASLRNVQSGAILAVNADPEPLKDRVFGRSQQVVAELDHGATQVLSREAIQVALDAFLTLNTLSL